MPFSPPLGLSIHPQAALQQPIFTRCCYPSPPPLGPHPPPSPLKTQSSARCISHQDHPLPRYRIPWDAQTFCPLTRMRSGRVTLGHLHRAAWTQHPASPHTPSKPLGHHGPELPHLPELTVPQAKGGWPCGTGLCTVPGGPCSIRTRVGMLRSAAADARGCRTGLGCCKEGGMGPLSPWAPLSPGQEDRSVSPRGLGRRSWTVNVPPERGGVPK